MLADSPVTDTPQQLGWCQLGPEKDGSRAITTILCVACGTKRGVDPSRWKFRDWERIEDGDAGDEDPYFMRDVECDDCDRTLDYQLPLKCPRCGRDTHLHCVGLAEIHVSGAGEPTHASIRDDWREAMISWGEHGMWCIACGFEGDWDDFRGKANTVR